MLSASAATPLFGVDSVTFTVTVSGSPGNFTGSVDFYDTTTQTDLGSTPLMNGIATLSTSTLAVGGHGITASYSGDANFLSSSGSTGVMVIPPPASRGSSSRTSTTTARWTSASRASPESRSP